MQLGESMEVEIQNAAHARPMLRHAAWRHDLSTAKAEPYQPLDPKIGELNSKK
jgi:hypothetical protein